MFRCSSTGTGSKSTYLYNRGYVHRTASRSPVGATPLPSADPDLSIKAAGFVSMHGRRRGPALMWEKETPDGWE